MTARRITFPAEWEPHSGVQLTWPHGGTDFADDLEAVTDCFVQIATAIASYEMLLVVTPEAAPTANLLRHLDVRRIRIVSAPSNDCWSRDHGGITVLEDGRPRVLDYQFNGWGLKYPANHDNRITARLFAEDVFESRVNRQNCMNFVLEGGSLESDGEGTLLTTSRCLLSENRNDTLTRTAIEARLIADLGVDRVLWLKYGALEGDDTDSHIDTLARFVDPQTLAHVHCDDPSDPHYPEMARMNEEIAALRTRDNRPYRRVLLPWPEPVYDNGNRLPATYANFLILNGAVLMPEYGTPKDIEARHVLADAFPDRDIIGINCLPLIRQHGSLHCVTQQYPEGTLKGAAIE